MDEALGKSPKVDRNEFELEHDDFDDDEFNDKESREEEQKYKIDYKAITGQSTKEKFYQSTKKTPHT